MALPAAPRRARAASSDPAGAPSPPPLAAPALPGFTRRRIAFVVGALVVLWIVLVFARAVAGQAAATERADALRADNVARAARLAAGARELQIVQSPAFVRLQARAYGLGGDGERVFMLQQGAPPAPAITPLGGPESPAPPATPLEAWLTLFFGP